MGKLGFDVNHNEIGNNINLEENGENEIDYEINTNSEIRNLNLEKFIHNLYNVIFFNLFLIKKLYFFFEKDCKKWKFKRVKAIF